MLPDWFQDFSAVASVIGTALAFYVAIQATRIRNEFLFKARVPALVRQLSKLISELPRSLADGYPIEERINLLGRVEGLLISLKNKLVGPDKKAVERTLILLHPRGTFFTKAKLHELSEDQIWTLYSELGKVESQLKHALADFQWK